MPKLLKTQLLPTISGIKDPDTKQWAEKLNATLEEIFRRIAVRVEDSLWGDIPGGNYVTIDSTTGHIDLFGQATVWEDIQTSLIGRQLQSVAGKVDYNWDENSITFASGGDIAVANDRVNWSIQLRHRTKASSDVYPHIHFEQVTSNDVTFTLKYRLQANGSAKTSDWTTITANVADDTVFTYSAGTLNQILKFPAITVGSGISDVLQFQMARTDATAGDVEVTFVDCHFEADDLGSNTEYTK